MIRRLAALVLAVTLTAALFALAGPGAATAGRPSLPQVDCVAANTNPLTVRDARRMARKFNNRGWQVLYRLETKAREIREVREENRIYRATIADQQAQIEALQAQLDAEQEEEGAA